MGECCALLNFVVLQAGMEDIWLHLHSYKKYIVSGDYTTTCPQMITTSLRKLLILFGIRWFFESKPLC